VTRAVLSIGSNLGDRAAHLRSAVDGLGAAVTAVSPVYETAPWGPVPQADYLNAVLLVAAAGLSGADWLARAHALEAAAGRLREVRWGPRTLDVDVVTVDDERWDGPEVFLPHPRAHERAFVLVPWLDADPVAQLPGYGPVEDLVAALDPAERAGVRRRDDVLLRPWPSGAGR
jgi:2-amino-4-hydroxy-6-hydroxymethyldihydropteridine diphosphokinase